MHFFAMLLKLFTKLKSIYIDLVSNYTSMGSNMPNIAHPCHTPPPPPPRTIEASFDFHLVSVSPTWMGHAREFE
jgi:hypothetical protein